MGQGHDSSQWPVATVVTNRDFTGMAHSAELAELPLRVEVLHMYALSSLSCIGQIRSPDLHVPNQLFVFSIKILSRTKRWLI